MSTMPIFSLPHRAGSIAAVDGSISPQAFRTNGYDANFGWPVILRGAARKSPAFERWATDAALLAAHSDARVSVELGKFDARTPSARSSMMLGQFLATYNSSDSYLVADSPRGLGRDLALPPLLACRSRVPYLTAFYVWMSAGNTKSKVHYDESDNCLCQIDGTKRAALWNAAQKMTMESERTWWRSAPDDCCSVSLRRG